MLPTDALRYGFDTVTWLRWIPAVLLLLPWLLGPTVPTIDTRVRALAGPVGFHLLDWETSSLGARAGRLWEGLHQTSAAGPDDVAQLRDYFSLPLASRTDQRPAIEPALERVVSAAYLEAGVTREQPAPLPTLFPPVLVALTAPPNVLVTAPRDALRVLTSTIVQPLDPLAQAQLEDATESSGVAALVTPIGGIATYPAMVLDDDSPGRVLSSVAHEWVHQYLIFYPLGQQYWSSQEAREINETSADLVGQEIGEALAREYGLTAPAATGEARPAPALDFRSFMRTTRSQVEAMLRDHDIAGAEAYMRDRQAELNRAGYAVRKLNQAYFAMYGSYGEGFAAAPDNPIPRLLRQLREQSPTVADFLARVRTITTVAELRAAVS
jgi:hypothetical protein